jgi:hypothetical protein
LITLLEKEANRITREDEARRLKALCSSIIHQLYLAKENEDTARYGQNKAEMKSTLGMFALGGMIKLVSKNKRLLSFADHLLDSLIDDERPFGNVSVCIGSKGIPDDVRVVSISRLARESNRAESEVIRELQKRGCLLFSEKDFSLLIEKLVVDIQGGRLRLPVSCDAISQATVSNTTKLIATNTE